MNPLVSIIIPLYNAENYIADTIRSADTQTWPNKEIIIVDDGSTDNSLAIARQFVNDYTKVYAQTSLGAAAARNAGLKNAKGDYVQFLDADDLLSTNKIADQMALLLKFPGYIALCDTVHFFDDKGLVDNAHLTPWFANGTADAVDFLVKLYGGDLMGDEYGGMLAVHAWLCPRGILNKAGLWDESLSRDDDGEYFCRVLLASEGVVYAKGALTYYRKYLNAVNLSAQKGYAACLSGFNSNLLKAKHLLANTDNPKAKQALSRLFWDNTFSSYPYYRDIHLSAQRQAVHYDSKYRFQPYKQGVKRVLAGVFGWKFVRYIEFLKQRMK